MVLVAFVDHEPPKVVLPLFGLVGKHHEPDGHLVGVDGAEPSAILGKVCFGDRNSIRRDEVCLIGRDR